MLKPKTLSGNLLCIVLADYETDRILYLAIDEDVFNNNFSEALRDLVRNRLQIKVLVFNSESEEVVKWLI